MSFKIERYSASKLRRKYSSSVEINLGHFGYRCATIMEDLDPDENGKYKIKKVVEGFINVAYNDSLDKIKKVIYYRRSGAWGCPLVDVYVKYKEED